MRKIYLILTTLILGIVATYMGGVFYFPSKS